MHVVTSYRGESDAGVPFKIEKLIELQDARVPKKDAPAGTLLRTYKAAIAVISKTRDAKKAAKVKKLLTRIQTLKNNIGDDTTTLVDLTTAKNVLRTCAYTISADPKDKLAAFQIAVDVFNELREAATLDSSVFSLFIKATALLPANRKRDAVIENVFFKCCQDGLIADYILQDFENVASDELQLKVLGGMAYRCRKSGVKMLL